MNGVRGESLKELEKLRGYHVELERYHGTGRRNVEQLFRTLGDLGLDLRVEDSMGAQMVAGVYGVNGSAAAGADGDTVQGDANVLLGSEVTEDGSSDPGFRGGTRVDAEEEEVELGVLLYNPEFVKDCGRIDLAFEVLRDKYGPNLDIVEVAKVLVAAGVSRAKKGDGAARVKTVVSSLYSMIRKREDLEVVSRTIQPVAIPQGGDLSEDDGDPVEALSA